MFLLALAVAPGIAVCLFIYSLNKYGRGSMRYLVLSFVLCMLATVPALLVQMLAEDVRDAPSRHSILSYAWYAYIVVALSEEGSKFLVLRCYAYPKKSFVGPFDGIVYSVMIGMGFATIENIEYVRQFGAEIGFSRFFLAIPAHASFAVLMGYPAGKAKMAYARMAQDRITRDYDKSNRSHAFWLMLQGLLVAVLFHGSFDFFLFLQQKREATKYFSTGILSFGTFASFYIAVRLAMRAIRRHRADPDESDDADQEESDKLTGEWNQNTNLRGTNTHE
jgi:RsiW-degrading membrane proteinase PrsW (M82 family)